MEFAVSFTPLRPAGFVNFTGQGLLCGAEQPVFPLDGASIPGKNEHHLWRL